MAIKITIEQIDIEQAIKDHIGSMMEIKPDAQLDIDLSATRGSAGFTATILIRNADEVARESTATATTTTIRPISQPESAAEATVVTATTEKLDGRTKAAKALNIPKANDKPKEEDAPVEEASLGNELVASAQETQSNEDNVSADIAISAADEVVSDDLSAQEKAEQPAEATEAAPRASLFSNLNKPKN
jgi:hypothetical protein